MGLFKPAWASMNLSRALKAIEKVAARHPTSISTDNKLKAIVKEAPLTEVRIKALGKITDEHDLADLAGWSPHENIAQAAFDMITDQDVLCEIVLWHGKENQSVAEQAWDKLNKESLVDIASGKKTHLHSFDFSLCDKAMARITDKAVIAAIYANTCDESVRLSALSRLAAGLPSEIHSCLWTLFVHRSCNHDVDSIVSGRARRREVAMRLREFAKTSPEQLEHLNDIIKREVEKKPSESESYYSGPKFNEDGASYSVKLYGVGMKWPY